MKKTPLLIVALLVLVFVTIFMFFVPVSTKVGQIPSNSGVLACTENIPYPAGYYDKAPLPVKKYHLFANGLDTYKNLVSPYSCPNDGTLVRAKLYL